MALLELNWFSQILLKAVGTRIIVPDTGKGPFPVFYLLHGLSDDYTIWHRRTRIEWYVRDLPLIVVMPDGYRNFYTDNDQGPAMAKHIGEELPGQVERLLPAKTGRAGRAIGGLSMGGYGALRVGLGYPDRFASITSHSGALMHGSMTYTKPQDAEFRRVFGPRPAGSDHDLVHLARRCKRAGTLPKIRIDCGTGDFLLDDNRRYHAALRQLDVPHEYEEFPGVHDWDYWDGHVREAIAFHARNLKIGRVSSR